MRFNVCFFSSLAVAGVGLSVSLYAGSFGFDTKTKTFGNLFQTHGVKGYYGSFFVPQRSSTVIDNRMLSSLGLGYRITDFKRQSNSQARDNTVRFELESDPRAVGVSFSELSTSVRSGRMPVPPMARSVSPVDLVFSDATFDIEN